MAKIRQQSFEAIGTKWSVAVTAPISDSRWAELIEKIYERVKDFDERYSRFKKTSWVTALSAKPGTYRLPDDAFELLSFYKSLYQATSGRVTPMIGQTIADAGYDADYSFEAKPLSRPPDWDEAIDFSRQSIEIKKPVLLDFGAAGKGYLVDIIGSIVADSGIHDYVIDASGDILHRNSSKLVIRVGLENPLDTTQAIGVAELGDKSLCASAGSRRKWGKYHHLINPRTLESPQNIVATWVIADDTMTADGLATALFFCEPDKMPMYKFSYAVLNKDMSIEHSTDFPAEFFKA